MSTLIESSSSNMLYSVEQIQDIIFRGEMFALPESILSLLKKVESQLEIVEYPTTVEHTAPTAPFQPRHKHHSGTSEKGERPSGHGASGGGYRNKFDIPSNHHNHKQKSNHNHHNNNPIEHSNKKETTRREITDDDWESMRSFKTTKIETKTGIEKRVNDLRVLLNKISAATYDKQRDAILAAFREYFGNEEADVVTEENTARLSKAVFDIASTNKFYAELYANLFQELVREFDVFKQLLAKFVETFCQTSTQNIVYIDPDVDYDGYCAYTKQSDIRKSTATFIVCCLMRGLVELDDVMDIVVEFIESVLKMKDETGKTKEVEEITELVFIMVCAMHETAKAETKWEEQVMQEVERLSKMKAKDYASLSNRAVFKFMDLMDKL